MRDEQVYGFFGPLVTMGAVALFIGSFYWAGHGVYALTLRSASDQVAAVLAVLVLGAVVGAMVKLPLLGGSLLFALAAFDRLFMAQMPAPLGGLIGAACLVLALVALVILLAEHVKAVNSVLPQVLLAVVGAVFLAPVALIVAGLRLVGLVKPQKYGPQNDD